MKNKKTTYEPLERILTPSDKLTSLEEQDEKLTRLNKSLDYIDQLQEKYEDLVWYARSDRDYLLKNEIYESCAQVQRIEKKYPDEVIELQIDDNWSHGFNSGILAACRLFKGMLDKDGYEAAIAEFPFLDT